MNLIDGTDVSGVVSNAINPFWVVALSIPLVNVWNWLEAKGLEPSTPAKMALGMLLTEPGLLDPVRRGQVGRDQTFLTDGNGQFVLDEHGELRPSEPGLAIWLIAAYMVISLGELMLSPMGLSLVSKVAPARMRGLMMGGWFVATAIGNKLTVIGMLWTKWYHSSFWLLCSLLGPGHGPRSCSLLLRPLKKSHAGCLKPNFEEFLRFSGSRPCDCFLRF